MSGAIWCDYTLPLAKRVAALVANLTLEEKSVLFTNNQKPIPRIRWPAYSWWNEALHGVARAGLATSWPQVIGIGSTFNKTLWYALGAMTSTEARGMNSGQGKTYWAPNINIFRDPRWGRGK
jgi:beta-glucosidase